MTAVSRVRTTGVRARIVEATAWASPPAAVAHELIATQSLVIVEDSRSTITNRLRSSAGRQLCGGTSHDALPRRNCPDRGCALVAL